MPATPERALDRRWLLLGAIGSGAVLATVGLSACSGGGDSGISGTSAPGGASSGASAENADAVRTDAATNERALVAAYDRVIAAFPALAPSLGPLRTQHADHLTALGIDGAEPPVLAAPATAQAALSELRSAEQAAARSRRAGCVAASDADLARLLALIAASEQSHVPALKRMTA